MYPHFHRGDMAKPSQFYTFVNLDRKATVAARVEVAGTSRVRRRGLLQVSSMDADAGLWIVPCEAIHTFGMKVPIDSVFLDKQMCVRSVRRELRPGRIAICLRAHSVLELAAGTIERSGTVVGDRLAVSDTIHQ